MIDARKHTLDSVKKLTDYSDFNLYKMDICYDYSIDKIIDRGAHGGTWVTGNNFLLNGDGRWPHYRLVLGQSLYPHRS